MLDISDASSFRCETLDRDISFKTYSDAKLAGLLFDDGFTLDVMIKFFHLFLDPKFSLQDITFKGVEDIFKYVCVIRGKNAVKRERATPFPPRSDGCSAQLVATTSNSIPPVALDMVVDCMLKDSVPLGIAAKEPFWEDAYAKNGLDFRNMSLVHRSWTTISQRALRRRVVVPYHRIDRFLLSPLCGPWVKEMIVYWTVDDVDRNVTKNEILLLEALLKRTPNVHSLSFNTSLVYRYDDRVRCYDEPPPGVDDSLDIISTQLPSLEHLWLKHFERKDVRIGMGITRESLSTCPGLRSLCIRIPRFRSLKFLSIWGWSSGQASYSERLIVDPDEHPPCQLKTIELDFTCYLVNEADLIWLLKPRGNYHLESLWIENEDKYWPSDTFGVQEGCFSELSELRLCTDSWWGNKETLVAGCKKLNNLDLFVNNIIEPHPPILPSSLKHWTFHVCDDEVLYGRLEEFFRNLEPALPRLPLLQDIHIAIFPIEFPREKVWSSHLYGRYEEEKDALEEHMYPGSLKDQFDNFVGSLMEKYNIEISCTRAYFS